MEQTVKLGKRCPFIDFKPCQESECVMWDDRRCVCLIAKFLKENRHLSSEIQRLKTVN